MCEIDFEKLNFLSITTKQIDCVLHISATSSETESNECNLFSFPFCLNRHQSSSEGI